MNCSLEITDQPLVANELLASVASSEAGAAILFVGTTRRMTGGRETASLDYECYREMALREMEKLAQVASEKWSLEGCAIWHRIGPVAIGEASVMIAVSSPHRRAAFEAGQWLIDELKETVPIWKKENWADGTSEWVHPGVTPAASGHSRNEPSHPNQSQTNSSPETSS